MPAATDKSDAGRSDAGRSAFLAGLRDGAPMVLGVAPFGLLFAVVASEAGLDILQVMGMSVLVIAGAAQFTALAQMQDGAPMFMVLAAALAVNMRMVMYSASLAPWLGDAPFWQRALAAYILVDNTYAQGMSAFERNPGWSVGRRMRYYMGIALPSWVAWYLFTFLGAWFGRALPEALALDFAPPIIFISIVAPMLKSLAHVAAALTSVIVALGLSFLPHSAGLMVAALAAMAVGAAVEALGGRPR